MRGVNTQVKKKKKFSPSGGATIGSPLKDEGQESELSGFSSQASSRAEGYRKNTAHGNVKSLIRNG